MWRWYLKVFQSSIFGNLSRNSSECQKGVESDTMMGHSGSGAMNGNDHVETSFFELHRWGWPAARWSFWNNLWWICSQSKPQLDWSPSTTLIYDLIRTILKVGSRTLHGHVAWADGAVHSQLLCVYQMAQKDVNVIEIDKPKRAAICQKRLFVLCENILTDCHMREIQKI